MAVWNLEVVRQTCAAYNLDFGGTFWHANSDFRQSPTQITALDWRTKATNWCTLEIRLQTSSVQKSG